MQGGYYACWGVILGVGEWSGFSGGGETNCQPGSLTALYMKKIKGLGGEKWNVTTVWGGAGPHFYTQGPLSGSQACLSQTYFTDETWTQSPQKLTFLLTRAFTRGWTCTRVCVWAGRNNYTYHKRMQWIHCFYRNYCESCNKNDQSCFSDKGVLATLFLKLNQYWEWGILGGMKWD